VFSVKNKDLTELLDLEISENKIWLFSYVGEQTALNFIDAGQTRQNSIGKFLCTMRL
jgi:hypothetical protein